MKNPKLDRFLEVIPGIAMWFAFLGPIILTFIIPKVVMIVLMLYALYWLTNSIQMALHLYAGYLTYKKEIKKHWVQLLEDHFPKEYKKIYHLIIIATYKEELLTLRQSVQAIADSDYDLKKIYVLLATEERDHERGTTNAKALEKEFGHRFGGFWSFEHPKNIPGEVIGKGGNITYAAKHATQKFQDIRIDPKSIIVTTLDADHLVDKKYIACLTYKFLSTPDNLHRSYQPLPMFFNNIWEVPSAMRIVAFGSSFWQMIESTRTYRLRNFASHAQPLAGLIESDYWATDTIVEDGRQFWRSWFAFSGNYSVVPIGVPVYQDAVLADNLKETLKQQYLQKRRWAWGVSDFPYVIEKSIEHKEIPLLRRIIEICRVFEGNFSWSTSSIILAFVAWVPVWIRRYSEDILSYNFPIFYTRMLGIATVGMIVTLIVATKICPPPPKDCKWGIIKIIKEWILTLCLITPTNIIFGSIPAVESQTRLMIGKYLNIFNVTPKKAIEIPKERHV